MCRERKSVRFRNHILSEEDRFPALFRGGIDPNASALEPYVVRSCKEGTITCPIAHDDFKVFKNNRCDNTPGYLTVRSPPWYSLQGPQAQFKFGCPWRMKAVLEVEAEAEILAPLYEKKACCKIGVVLGGLALILAPAEALDERFGVLGGLPKYPAIRDLEA